MRTAAGASKTRNRSRNDGGFASFFEAEGMSKSTRFVMKRMMTVMRNKAKKDTTSKHSIKKLWLFFTELPIFCQLLLVLIFCLFPIELAIDLIIKRTKEDLVIENLVMEDLVIENLVMEDLVIENLVIENLVMENLVMEDLVMENLVIENLVMENLVMEDLVMENLVMEDLVSIAGVLPVAIIVVSLIVIISAYIFLIINNNKKNKKNNVKIDPCELVKELESFGIKKENAIDILVSFEIIRTDDAKNIIANEIQSNTFGLKNITKNDYQFSQEHYEFIYSSLFNYLTGKERLEAISFLDTSICKYKRNYFLDISYLSFVEAIILAIVFGYESLEGLINNISNLWDGWIIKCLLFILLVITFLLLQTIKNKGKYDFYLSILNQLKEDLKEDPNRTNRKQISVGNGKAPDPAEENPTADLPVVDKGNDNNDNADKS